MYIRLKQYKNCTETIICCFIVIIINNNVFSPFRGKVEEVLRLEQQLSELEDRANHLDKMRTSTISSISYINDRNRKKNVEEAEKAILVIIV